jgi:hypothetical protein
MILSLQKYADHIDKKPDRMRRSIVFYRYPRKLAKNKDSVADT